MAPDLGGDVSKGIVVARPNARVERCVGCRQPWPAEQLDPIGLCGGCWVNAGVAAGRSLTPSDLMMMAEVIRGHIGERGGPEDRLQCLLRLLEERLRLVAWEDDERPVPLRCCYCGELMAEGGDAETGNLETLADLPGAPVLWRCRDHQRCKTQMVRALTPKPGRGVA